MKIRRLWMMVGFVLLMWYLPSAAAEDSVKIVAIEPDPAIPLSVGSEVRFKVEVDYQTDAGSASVNLVLQKGEFSGKLDDTIGSAMDVVFRGSGRLVLEKTIVIPDTKAIQVFVPLMASETNPTSVVDARVFKVVKE